VCALLYLYFELHLSNYRSRCLILPLTLMQSFEAYLSLEARRPQSSDGERYDGRRSIPLSAGGQSRTRATPIQSTAPKLMRLSHYKMTVCLHSTSTLFLHFLHRSLPYHHHSNVILRTSIPAPRSRIRRQDIMRPITRYPTSHFRVKGWFSITMGSREGERMGCKIES